MGFVDNLAHINARYSLISIKLAQEYEKDIGVTITNKIKEKWDEALEKDKKISFDKKFDNRLFHINNVRKIKYAVLLLGIIITVYSFL